MKKLFVRNLSFNTREEHLKEVLSKVSENITVSLPRIKIMKICLYVLAG